MFSISFIIEFISFLCVINLVLLKDTDFADVKVVEKILGRRISTRPIKKSTTLNNFAKAKCPSLDDLTGKPIAGEADGTEAPKEGESQEKKEVELADEEEEEEQVEEFYLKYKGL